MEVALPFFNLYNYTNFKGVLIHAFEFSFSKGSLSYRTQIEVYDEKVWIKAYSGGYGESDTIRFPITKKQFLAFIRSNAV